MRTDKHFVVGALVGGLASIMPDAVLALYGWRKDRWLPESHPLVKAHRFIHRPSGLLFIWLLGWSAHVVADWFSEHRTEADWALAHEQEPAPVRGRNQKRKEGRQWRLIS